MSKRILLAMLMALLALPALGAADKKANREKEMLRRVQSQLQQSEGERSALAEEKAKLSKDLDASKKQSGAMSRKLKGITSELEEARKQLEQVNKDLEAARLENTGLKERLAKTETDLGQTRQQLATTSQTLRVTEADKRQLESIRKYNEKVIADQGERNNKLYALGREILGHWQRVAGAQSDPILGLKRVEIENLGETLRDALDEQRITSLAEAMPGRR